MHVDGIVDIYMPDFKFWTSYTSQRLCKAKNYPEEKSKYLNLIILFTPFTKKSYGFYFIF